MAKTIYLHIGLHKTASTSFQATCAHNRELLNTHDIHYPCFAGKNQSYPDNHSLPLHTIFSRNAAKHHLHASRSLDDIEAEKQLYTRQLREAILGHNKILISGEDVSDLTVDEMKDLRIYLQARSRQLIVFGLIRSPYELHCSAYAAMTVHGGRNLSPTNFLSQKTKILKCKAAFSKHLQLSPFRTACSHKKGIINYLLSRTGSGCYFSEKQIIRRNEGADNKRTRIQAIINKTQQKVVNGELNHKWHMIHAFGNDKFLLTPKELSQIQSDLNNENAFMKDTLGIDFCDQIIQTCDPISTSELEKEAAQQVKTV